MNDAELTQIASRWNRDDTGWRQPGHVAACTDIERLVAEVRRLRREVAKSKQAEVQGW